MQHFTKVYIVLSAALVAAAMLVVPASAHVPTVLWCQGIMKATPQSWFFTDWDLELDCWDDANPERELQYSIFHASGTAYGTCGTWSALSNGTGYIEYPYWSDSHATIGLSGLGWEQGIGTITPVRGSHDHGGLGIVTATIQGIDCVTSNSHRMAVNVALTLS